MNKAQRALRHDLHRHPDRSNTEAATAERIRSFFGPFAPDRIVTGIGGTGLAAVYEGRLAGPCLVFRCELDALPIEESEELDYASQTVGISHKCGHDGHMAIVAGLAPFLHDQRPTRGRIVLLFQPAEETGEGAARVLESPDFLGLAPDRVYALHNLPGLPLGTVVLRDGVFAAGSKGMVVRFTGATSHAAEPEKGNSPALAVADLIRTVSEQESSDDTFATVIHARLGERSFGVTPGFGEVLATLRSVDAERLEQLSNRCAAAVAEISAQRRIPAQIEWVEQFSVTCNSSVCVEGVRKAAEQLGYPIIVPPEPFRWSEDFGRFTELYAGALFGLGSGVDHPALHRPEYDFPDELLERGTQLFLKIARLELE